MQSVTQSPDIAAQKAALRIEVRRTLNSQSAVQLRAEEDALFERFLALEQVARANVILLFWGITGLEPDTTKLLPRLWEIGKTVCMPRTLPARQMETRIFRPDDPYTMAPFGVPEPDLSCPLVAKEAIDLALVPAMCYDRGGYRLGFGGGYYDRWLSDFAGQTVGLCRESVLHDALPREVHDRPVGTVLTRGELIVCETGA